MRTGRQLLCLLLCAALCLALFGGCAAPDAADSVSQSTAAPESSTDGGSVTDKEENVAVLNDTPPEKATMTKHANDLMEHAYSFDNQAVFADGRIWFYGYRLEDENDLSSPIFGRLLSTLPDGTDARGVDLTFPELKLEPEPVPAEGESLGRGLDNLIDGGGKLLALWHLSHVSFPSGYYYPLRVEYRLSNITADGVIDEGFRLDIDIPEGYDLTYKGTAAGSIWFEYAAASGGRFTEPSRLMAFSLTDGSLLADIPLPTMAFVESFTALAGNRALVQLTPTEPYGENYGFRLLSERSTCHLLDLTAETITLGESLVPPESLRTNGTSQLVAQPLDSLSAEAAWWNNNGLYLWDVDANTLTHKYDWLEFGGGAYTLAYDALYFNDGRYFLLESTDSRKARALCWIEPAGTAATEDDGRTVITVGTVDPAPLTDAVTAFNLASATHRVELVTYTGTDAQAAGLGSGTDLLLRDIAQGAIPDIVVLPNGADSAALLNKGLFTDLYPLIDGDPDMARSDFVEGLLEACETGGQLTTVVPYYNVFSAAGSVQKLGTAPGWSWDEFEKAAAACRTPYYGLSREMALWYQVQMGGDRFVDYGTGKANFDSDAFVRLLESCAAYPEQMPDLTADTKAAFARGEYLLQFLFNIRFDDVATLVYQFDGPIVYKGLPSGEGNGSVFTFGLRLGITSACKDPDAAWQFLRTLLLPDFQNALTEGYVTYLPLRRDTLVRLADRYAEPHTNGVSVPPYLGEPTKDQTEYFGRALTAEERGAVLDLIESTDTLFQYDGTVYDILAEEALNYYNGMCSAGDAARYIQNRVQLYLDEQA